MSSLAVDVELTCSVLLLGTTLASTAQASQFHESWPSLCTEGHNCYRFYTLTVPFTAQTLMANCLPKCKKQRKCKKCELKVSSYGEDAVRMTYKPPEGGTAFLQLGVLDQGLHPSFHSLLPHTGDGMTHTDQSSLV